MISSQLRNLLLSAAFLSLATVASAREWETKTLSRVFPFDSQGSITVENINGPIEIVAWDRAEVSVEAVLRSKSAGDLGHIHVDIDAGADRLVVRTRQDVKRGFFWDRGSRGDVTYRLHVPAGVSLEKIVAENSSIKVVGVRGRVNLASENGGIRATGLAGDGRFSTPNGSITAEYDSFSATTTVALDAENGACTLRLPAEVSARLVARTKNGGVSCDFPLQVEDSGRGRLQGVIGSGTGEISLRSSNGSVSIRRAR